MKITRKRGYNNYGMYPTNEYTVSNEAAGADTAVDASDFSRAPGVELGQFVESVESDPPMRRLPHYLLRLRKRGWLRTQSTSGWRAKAAAEQHEDFHT